MTTTEEPSKELTFKEWVNELNDLSYLKLRINAEARLRKSGILYILENLDFLYTPDEIFQDAWERMAKRYRDDDSKKLSEQFYRNFWDNLEWAGQSVIEDANAKKRKLEGRLVDIDDPLANLQKDDEPLKSKLRPDTLEDELINELNEKFIRTLPDAPPELKPICQFLIRNIIKDGSVSQTELAVIFNISSSKVTRIKQDFQERMANFILANL